MHTQLRPILLLFTLLIVPFWASAQLVNMEQTWQEFLSKQKASNVSKLVKPERSQPANYLKYSLMYANSYFCADNLAKADEMMREITTIDPSVQDRIPGFKERYALMKTKIKAYKDFAPLWKRYRSNPYSVSRADVEKIPEAKKVCEKGTLAKVFYLTAQGYYCEGKLAEARGNFENRVQKLAKTTFDPTMVDGLSEAMSKMERLWVGIDALKPAWDAFVETDVSTGFTTEVPVYDCYTIPNIKVCLLQAAANFCQDGDEMLRKIRAFQQMNDHAMPTDVAAKITWLENMVQQNTKAIAQLNKAWTTYNTQKSLPASMTYEHTFVCNRALEVKAHLLDGLRAPCTNGAAALVEIKKVRDEHQPSLDNETTTLLKQLKQLVANERNALDKLNAAWKDFLPDNQLSGKADFGFEYCDKAALAKAYTMDGILNLCDKGKQRAADIASLRKAHNPPLDAATTKKIDFLNEEVKRLARESAELDKAWKHLLTNKKVSPDLPYTYEFQCDRAKDVQALLLDAYKNPCKGGTEALGKIKKVQDQYNPTLDAATQKRLDQLKDLVANEKGNLAALNKAWKDFLPDDAVEGKLNISFEYCNPEDIMKAYIMDGTVYFCEKGVQRLKDGQDLVASAGLSLTGPVKTKFEALKKKVAQSEQDLQDLNTAWTLYTSTDTQMEWLEGYPTPDDGTVRDNIRLVDFYCDPIAQTKSWVIKGQLDPCEKGDTYLAKIKSLKKKRGLSYDADLQCQVDRLKAKAYQCKYWTLVREARRLTHLEREEFGPRSAKVMYGDLNSDKQPCETTVVYEPIGYIGVKYVISPSLCQKVNLARMGDPEYYKKIATWVNTQVLTEYCEASMRCKEDFFVYLEGHTDGYRFSGRKYDQSLDIPEGTPYTHFLGKKDGTVDTLQKTTRNITRELKSNMELGIARAWTVKQQLDFMGVPITVGAYEHPETEKGGEYRKIDIELNITNLLLDFYEKTLERLVQESGIGKRPGLDC